MVRDTRLELVLLKASGFFVIGVSDDLTTLWLPTKSAASADSANPAYYWAVSRHAQDADQTVGPSSKLE